MVTHVAPGGVEGVKLELRLAHWPKELSGLSIVQLSDLHYRGRTSESLLRNGVAIANSLSADIIVLTGDYVTNSTRHVAACADALSALRARHGVYAVLGNHEAWIGADVVAEQFARAGIVMLRDESVRLKIAGSRLRLLGIEDTGYTGYNFPLLSSTHKFSRQWLHKTGVLGRLLGPIPESEPRILLVHNPDFVAMLPPGRIDLVLSGHTHGGQVRLPLLGTPILPSCFGNRHASGWIRGSNGTVGYVNRGLGMWPIRLRWNCRPEVTYFRVLPETL